MAISSSSRNDKKAEYNMIEYGKGRHATTIVAVNVVVMFMALLRRAIPGDEPWV